MKINIVNKVKLHNHPTFGARAGAVILKFAELNDHKVSRYAQIMSK